MGRQSLGAAMGTVLALVCACIAPPTTGARVGLIHGEAAAVPRYAGWAMTAYPEMTQEVMDALVARQAAAGANLVWIGHNNPGEVGVHKREPGLSYAVYAAARDATSPVRGEALAMVHAEERLLLACRRAGVKAVLPVGYQIQMGRAWNAAHPDDVRRDAAGQPLNLFGGGVSASYYAPAYRRDIRAYYAWVNRTFVKPYSATIAMLNLADEPSGGDYSRWADRAFRLTHRYGLQEAGADAARQREVGAFESAYIAEYARWSAAEWVGINPAVNTTMSFDGGQSRYAYQAPAVERLFRDPPATFAVTFDAYPRDGLFDTPLREGDLIALDVFARALGAYSARYHRPLYLWSAANSWGLNEASSDPGTIADAVANGLALAMWVASTGGDLRGIAAWTYNVKAQGLYNDTHTTTYTPDAMFHAVSASFPTLRGLMRGPRGTPDTLLLAASAPANQLMGALRVARGLDPYGWADLAALARNDVATGVVGSLAGAVLDETKRIIILPTQPGELSGDECLALRRYLLAGGTVIAAPGVAAAVAGYGTIPARGQRLHRGRGTVVVALCGISVEACFSDTAGTEAGLWESLLGGAVNHGGYLMTGGGGALLYTINARGTIIHTLVPTGQTWRHGVLVATEGTPRIHLPDAATGAAVTVSLARREYAFYTTSAPR
ncbi:MAG: hypothetical protein NVSMB65_02180 [Chloroflexota bacterium]